jgi:hypothetical protein
VSGEVMFKSKDLAENSPRKTMTDIFKVRSNPDGLTGSRDVRANEKL